MVCFIEEESGLPVASLFTGPIMVESPISCLLKDVPAPALDLSSPSIKLRCSGPKSSIFSDITKPQLPQKISPLSELDTFDPLTYLFHLFLANCMPFCFVFMYN